MEEFQGLLEYLTKKKRKSGAAAEQPQRAPQGA